MMTDPRTPSIIWPQGGGCRSVSLEDKLENSYSCATWLRLCWNTSVISTGTAKLQLCNYRPRKRRRGGVVSILCDRTGGPTTQNSTGTTLPAAAGFRRDLGRSTVTIVLLTSAGLIEGERIS
jgi:hypothetical protein